MQNRGITLEGVTWGQAFSFCRVGGREGRYGRRSRSESGTTFPVSQWCFCSDHQKAVLSKPVL